MDLAQDSLVANGFNATLPTTVVIHGYGHDITDPLYANVAAGREPSSPTPVSPPTTVALRLCTPSAALLYVRAPTNVLGVDWGVL